MKTLLFFLFIPCVSFSQIDYRVDYYPYTNKAENELVKGDYIAAVNSYNEAFKVKGSVFAKDLYNASAAKLLQKDPEGAKKYLIKLAKKGVPAEFLEKKPIGTMFGSWWYDYKPFYQQVFEVSKEANQNEIWTKFDSLSILQYHLEEETSTFPYIINGKKVQIKVKDYDPKMFSDSLYFTNKKINYYTDTSLIKSDFKVFNDSLKVVLEEKENEFFEILEKHGFVSEELLFAATNNSANLPSKRVKRYILNYDRNLDLIFNTQADFLRWYLMPMSFRLNMDLPRPVVKENLEIKNQILEGLKNGKILPEVANTLQNYNVGIHRSNKVLIKVNIENRSDCDQSGREFEVYLKNTSKVILSEEETNNKRAEFGLCSIQNQLLKDIYIHTSNMYFMLNTDTAFEETTVSSCETAALVLKDAVLIKNLN
ncbi:hypothetical protein [Lacihabitans lacunae]|uniref:Tetratricopeptide repeat protein n=1 Tax=Lacihabitans lacunae TaxID=1028214 RepID=A0ABV7Z0N0_9BACT